MEPSAELPPSALGPYWSSISPVYEKPWEGAAVTPPSRPLSPEIVQSSVSAGSLPQSTVGESFAANSSASRNS